MASTEGIDSKGDHHLADATAGFKTSGASGDNSDNANEVCANMEIRRQNTVEQEAPAGDQRAEDSYLTEEDIFQMKNLTAQRGTTSEAMRSVMSLADTASNFEDRVLSEEADDSEVANADAYTSEEKEAQGSETADSEYFFPDQCAISGSFAFDRHRPPNPKLPNTVTVLNYPFAKEIVCDPDQRSEIVDALAQACVYLVGTAHFSHESQTDVLQTIQNVQPDVVMVELCPSRISLLSMEEETILREFKELTMEKISSIIKQSGIIQGILYVLLLSMSAHVTKQLGMAPGGEMRAAYDGAKKVQQCRIVLGDRPVHITLQRALGSLNFFQKIRFFFSLITSTRTKITSKDVERCKESDILEAFLNEVAEEFPTLSRILVEERDMYMVNTLQNVLRSNTLEKLDASKAINAKYQPVVIVAVVGIGHVPGIISHWEKRTSTAELLKIPEPSRTTKIMKYGFEGIIVSLLIYGVYRCGVRMYNKIFP